MAPETIEDQQETLSTDLWALGCIIYKMATGKVPFPGDDNKMSSQKIRNKEIEWPTAETMDLRLRSLIFDLL